MNNVKVTGPVLPALVPLIVEAVRALFRKHPERRQQPELELTVDVDGQEVKVRGTYHKRDTLRRLDFDVTHVDGEDVARAQEKKLREKREGRGRARIKGRRGAGVQVAHGPGAIEALFKGTKAAKAAKATPPEPPVPSANGAGTLKPAVKKAAKAAKKATTKTARKRK